LQEFAGDGPNFERREIGDEVFADAVPGGGSGGGVPKWFRWTTCCIRSSAVREIARTPRDFVKKSSKAFAVSFLFAK